MMCLDNNYDDLSEACQAALNEEEEEDGEGMMNSVVVVAVVQCISL